MPPPWGQCGATNLNYFSFYSVSTCVTECETDYVFKQCGCIDISMPSGDGQYEAGPKCVIELSFWFSACNFFQFCVSFIEHVYGALLLRRKN